MLTFQQQIEYIARRHFEREDVEIYVKMVEWMEKIIDTFDVTATLEVNSELFLQFMNAIGYKEFYEHIGRINMPSTQYMNMTKKECFERELTDAKISLQASREKIIKEGHDRIAAMEAQQKGLLHGVAQLARDHAKLNALRAVVIETAEKINADYRITNAEVQKLIEAGDPAAAREKMRASDKRIVDLEMELKRAQEELAKEQCYFEERLNRPSLGGHFGFRG